MNKERKKPKIEFPGKAPIKPELIAKHKRGDGLNLNKGKTPIKNKIHLEKLKTKEKKYENAAEQAARSELLLTEDYGYLETEAGETTTQFRQNEIRSAVDITSATKSFQLKLDFGSYRLKYSRNGRHLLIGGKMGHVAAFDWLTKKLSCEMNVMESVYDVSWLHIETMYAVAQKKSVYVYDNQGIELHCLKRMQNVTRLEFLPYHFLLAAGSDTGCLSWLDISIGKIVSRRDSKINKLSVMTQNPSNAILCCGDSKGVVSMWSPNSHEPEAKMLCHKQAISSIAVHPYGTYMATSSPDRSVKVWDARQLSGPVHNFILRSPAQNLSYSQRGLLAVSMDNVVEVFKDDKDTMKPYLRHKESWSISGMQFCPYEDVLGIGTEKGFVSLIVPGAAEANFDALEANPFQTKSQRREAEVKALLDKIQPELISLDSGAIADVDVPTLTEKIEAKKKLMFIKPKKVDFKPSRTKAKGKGGTAKIVKTKNILKALSRREAAETMKKVQIEQQTEKKKKNIPNKDFGPTLNRFLPKSK
ncbi:hypothetical protein HCN44_001817 [Aphidius gifuensis]|uniref:BING4 C-terminal domain-containing protein n=1 Tax=Aphidius gifuensis TaxID=684658 RepID=A0A835CX54_APHGI|nr:WD repeat-containing protein 46 [Aphidius gifuensis]KAF7996185.1 hypothetical protein HCN44_001817 [Aphidius gifuensis]